MYPEALSLGKWSLQWSGLLWLCAVSILALHWHYLGHKRGWPPQAARYLTIAAICGAFIGARTAYLAANPATSMLNPVAFFSLTGGGWIFFGGLAGGAIGTVLTARHFNLPVISFFETAIPPVPLAHAVGRIGCLLNGCCFGSRYDGICAIRFPAGAPAWHQQVYQQAVTRFTLHSQPVHPVQLYEAAANLVLYIALIMLWRKNPPNGQITALYAVAYGMIRFCTEFFRGDSRLQSGPLHLAQIVSLMLAGAGILLLWKMKYATDKDNHCS